MAIYQVFKETTLPGTLQPHSIYLVAPAASPGVLEMYVTGALASNVRSIVNRAQIQAMIDASLGGVGGLAVVDDIAERDALTPTTNTQVLVIDASADPTVTAGAATYVYRVSTSTWIKISEAESQDLVLNWSVIVGRPTSSPAQIDAAVGASHTHSNLTELNKVGEDGDGNLTYNGSLPVIAWTSENW